MTRRSLKNASRPVDPRAGEALQADLVVMGLFGHSRLRETILGGVSRSLLADPPVPLLLSH